MEKMEKYNPRLIILLEARSPTAERAFNRLENRDRCEFVSESDGVVDISSRESTPAVQRHGPRIPLTFDYKPKNLEKGFVFGSDPRVCDVFLGERGAGFSRQQFRITFNEQGQVIFENTSRKEASVNYRGEKPSRRTHFTWILFHEYENIVITVGDLDFHVMWPAKREPFRAQYKVHRDAYLEERRNALPSLSQLGVESQQTTALLTAQHSPRQQPIYLPREELGRGSFGTVYKAVDVSTGNEYAAKMFHGGNWKKEVEILKSISHHHIVDFVDFSKEQKPLLVMEYLPLGNLASQDRITEEETLQILCQGLQALEYLHSHSPPLAHRDIKPENILVQSRIPFFIKLVDFGLAKSDSSLRTFCGTNEYVAPEVWEHHHYTAMVDIWSLGVVVLQFGYGLPKPSRKRKGKPWCRDLAQFAEDGEGEGDALMDLISTKMLRMDCRDRQSASDCLGEVYRLGLHAIQPVKIGRTTPTGKTTGQGGVVRTNSYITQPRQDAPSDSDISTGFDDKAGASKMTEVAPLNRELQGVHYYNLASPRSLGRHPRGPTQIGSPQTKDKATSMRSKRPQTTQSPPADAIERGESQRPRAFVSSEADERLSEQGPEQLERSISSNYEEPLATDVVSLIQDVRPVPQVAPRPIDHGLELQRDDYSNPVEHVNNYPTTQLSRFLVVDVLPHPVTVRRSDFKIRAIDICRASGQPRTVVPKIEREFKGSSEKVYDFKHRGTYVDFWVGVELCRRYGLAELEKELRTWKGVPQEAAKAPEHSEPEHPEFIEITDFSSPVMVRISDFRINASHIFRLTGHSRTTVGNFRNTLSPDAYKILRGSPKHQGTYVNFDVGIQLCRKYGLPELEKRLYSLKRTSVGLVLEAEPSHVGPWSQTSRRLPESPGSDTGLARNESTQPRGIWNRNQRLTSLAEPIPDSLITPEDAREMDLGSDVVGSRGSVTSREPRSIPRNHQLEPSIRNAKDAAPSRQLARDIRHSLLELADPHSPSAKSAQYEVWDSRPKLSELTEVEPDLRPSTWKTASHYGSFGDLFAPI